VTYYINVYETLPGGRRFLGPHSKAGIPNRHALYRLRITPKQDFTIHDVLGWRHD
jgi:hypothetical protein